LSGIASRERLFRLLDEGRKKRVICLAAPAGSGKTTLVASWLDSRNLPCLWYQFDEGDGDLATFFYYMGLAAKKAAPRRKKPLPLLTPEYLQGIPTFTRRYFETLYGRLTGRGDPAGRPKKGDSSNRPYTIVLDNYQDAPFQSGFHEMIANALDVIPEGVNVIVISRAEPPAQLSRLKANDNISLIGWNDVRFSLEEAGELLSMKGGEKPPDDKLRQLQEKTDGWAAGLILVMESARRGGSEPRPHLNTPRDIFDYFANEIFAKVGVETRQFLLKTSFFPTMTAPMAEKLTGISKSNQILSGLSRNHYFTDWRPLSEPVFQYHPLFREFLLAKAKEEFSEDELSNTQRIAASLLADSGNAEDAAELFCDAKDWDGLAKIILGQAQTLVMQGRSKTLEGWLMNLPEEIVNNASWLLYWRGACKLPFNATESRRLFEKAFERFRNAGDQVGTVVAWSGMADACLYEGEDYNLLDGYITALDNPAFKGSSFPSAEIEVRISTSVFNSLVFRRPDHPEFQFWKERVESFSERAETSQYGVIYLIAYYFWIGDFPAAGRLIDILDLKNAPPLAKLSYFTCKAMLGWLTASFESSMDNAEKGLILSEESGVRVWDIHLLEHWIAAALGKGDIEKAGEIMERISLNGARRLDRGYYEYLASWKALLQKDRQSFRHHAEMLGRHCDALGLYFGLCLRNTMNAQLFHEIDEHEKAEGELKSAFRYAKLHESRLVEYMAYIIESYMCFTKSEEARGLASLKEAMSIGRRHNFMNCYCWRPDVMSQLCTKALEHGIEVEYVNELIRKRNLTPSGYENRAGAELKSKDLNMKLENWPYAIKIYTLDKFEIIKDGKPLIFSRKAPKKPLEMLRAIIDLGGKGIKEERLCDLLWPESEGDMARQAFATTLKRLRRLLGDKRAIILKGGCLTINRNICWVDALSKI